jgi:hypothetical protein
VPVVGQLHEAWRAPFRVTYSEEDFQAFREGGAVLVYSGRSDDESALAQALVEAVANPGERRRRGALAYSHTRNRYPWSAIALRLARLYHEVATLPDPGMREDPTGYARGPKGGQARPAR